MTSSSCSQRFTIYPLASLASQRQFRFPKTPALPHRPFHVCARSRASAHELRCVSAREVVKPACPAWSTIGNILMGLIICSFAPRSFPPCHVSWRTQSPRLPIDLASQLGRANFQRARVIVTSLSERVIGSQANKSSVRETFGGEAR